MIPSKQLLRILAVTFTLLVVVNRNFAQEISTSDVDIIHNPIVSKAYELFEAGDSSAALELFNLAISEDESDISALLGQAMILADMQLHFEAFASYDTIVTYYPNHAFAWNGRGLAAFNMYDFDNALKSFKKSTTEEPSNGFFHESLAWTQMCRGEFADAVLSAKQATFMYNKSEQISIYPPLIEYFAYLESDDHANAKISLRYANQNKPVNRWPSPVVDYLQDLIGASKLISFVTNTAQETEAHTYIGLKLRSAGLSKGINKHLDWVSRHGDRRVFEYNLAHVMNLKDRVALLESQSETNF